MWHRDFPPEAKEMWDVLAKALMMRDDMGGGYVIVKNEDLRRAVDTQAELELHDDGSISFRVERN